MRHGQAARRGDFVAQAVYQAHVVPKIGAAEDWLTKGHPHRAPVRRIEGGVLGERASEQTVGQRAIGHHPDAAFAAEREHLAFHAPIEQVVANLEHVDRPHLQALLQERDIKVRHAHQTRLAGALDVVQGGHGLCQGRVGVGPVDQIDVDMVGAQAAETGVDLVQDRRPAAIAPRLAAGNGHDATLGGDDGRVAPTSQRGAERLLGVA